MLSFVTSVGVILLLTLPRQSVLFTPTIGLVQADREVPLVRFQDRSIYDRVKDDISAHRFLIQSLNTNGTNIMNMSDRINCSGENRLACLVVCVFFSLYFHNILDRLSFLF